MEAVDLNFFLDFSTLNTTRQLMKVQRTGWVFLMTGVCRAQLADSRCLELMNSKVL